MQLLIFLKSLLFYLLTDHNKLMGWEFDTFGRILGLRLLINRQRALHLISNPVSCVRYFEFDYCLRSLGDGIDHKQILDISSPYLFGFYISSKYKLSYHYLNPDKREFDVINNNKKFVFFKSQYTVSSADATLLPFKSNSVDNIISISVIEHIDKFDDSVAIREMWRILKPGGKLILTFPVKKHFEEEFREENVYSLGLEKKEGKYFFQRYYDKDTIGKRLLDNLPEHKIVQQELFGEIQEGFFHEYEKRWISYGLSETVKDPYYMTKFMKKFRSIDDIPGAAVSGITVQKVK